MKKPLLLISLFLGLSCTIQAQSKLSYTLLVNQSASANEVIEVCILQTNGGQCLSFEQTWKTNVTLNINYQFSERLRLQTGIGYNVLSQNDLNDNLDTNKFKIKYTSIPARLHYIISKGKVKFYTGLGIRTDIRLNGKLEITELANVVDTGRGIAISAEGLLGLEASLTTQLSLQLEPTFSTALTSYTAEPSVITGSPNILVGIPFTLIDEYPNRLGVSLGFTYRF